MIFDYFIILKENYVFVLNCVIIWYYLMMEFDFKIGFLECEMMFGVLVEVWVFLECDFFVDWEEINNVK